MENVNWRTVYGAICRSRLSYYSFSRDFRYYTSGMFAPNCQLIMRGVDVHLGEE